MRRYALSGFPQQTEQSQMISFFASVWKQKAESKAAPLVLVKDCFIYMLPHPNTPTMPGILHSVSRICAQNTINTAKMAPRLYHLSKHN